MAHALFGASRRATCPQELIDLILDEVDPTDHPTLKSCALVGRSFRPTSQKRIFSDLTILPDHGSFLALQRLEVVLSASPHLAQHVRTLHLVQTDSRRSYMWMQSAISAAILSVLNDVKSLRIRLRDWDHLDPTCKQAIYSLITRSSLSSIKIDGASFPTNPELIALLQCFPTSLESASFSDVWTNWTDLTGNSVPLHQLRLASLQLSTHAAPLFDWAIRAVDLRCLRYLHILLHAEAMDVVQPLLDGVINVEIYHLSFFSLYSHDGGPNLEKMQRLRTLEISVQLDWTEIQESGSPGEDNPLNDAMRALATAPPTVEHLILNLDIYDPDELPNFMGSATVSHLGEGLPALRDVVLRIISGADNAALQRGIRYVQSVFSRLYQKGMLTAIVVPP
ncbi:hypothetical protein B0H16DRAFT_1561138 [Mycena metata]|uniref:F-box domain-containing protein n=1 Tax=Mycena metata TaxID=1033252 RepID=A0AAD7II22_9AGAR|nr:hypothetical protein B0H16DRAFT_1561138 [Mycena metata]